MGRDELLALSDLVQAKKTQRDKDWPIVRRLIEADYYQHHARAEEQRVRFWLRELRTPELLMDLGQNYSQLCRELAPERPLLEAVLADNFGQVVHALKEEERREREADRLYWLPLKQELERLRHAIRSTQPPKPL